MRRPCLRPAGGSRRSPEEGDDGQDPAVVVAVRRQAELVSAALFSLQHYWQPWNWLLIFVLELILTTLVVRLRCLRLGIVMHILANSFGILVALFGVLT